MFLKSGSTSFLKILKVLSQFSKQDPEPGGNLLPGPYYAFRVYVFYNSVSFL